MACFSIVFNILNSDIRFLLSINLDKNFFTLGTKTFDVFFTQGMYILIKIRKCKQEADRATNMHLSTSFLKEAHADNDDDVTYLPSVKFP